jgi:lipoyl(octanoyl) transferase
MNHSVKIRYLDQQDYLNCWQAMKDFTDQRNDQTLDELWLVKHPAVFTLGQAGLDEHILNAHDIPVVKTDRGGQVTYHGQGQIVLYLLINIKRLGFGARKLVTTIENSIIETLKQNNIHAFAKKEAPGVYVNINKLNDAKIAALGLRIRKGCSYHGLSINFDMDLTPFSYINPCGYEGQAVTQVNDINNKISKTEFQQQLLNNLCEELGLIPIQAKA